MLNLAKKAMQKGVPIKPEIRRWPQDQSACAWDNPKGLHLSFLCESACHISTFVVNCDYLLSAENFWLLLGRRVLRRVLGAFGFSSDSAQLFEISGVFAQHPW